MLLKARLRTKEKLFCACDFDKSCGICLGMPGAVPQLNADALEAALKTAVALGCDVRKEISFRRFIERKNGKKSRMARAALIAENGRYGSIAIKRMRLTEGSGGKPLLAFSIRNGIEEAKGIFAVLAGVLEYLGAFEHGDSAKIENAENPSDSESLPELNIPPIFVDKKKIRSIRENLPEFAEEKLARYAKLRIDEESARFICSQLLLAQDFDSVMERLGAETAAKLAPVLVKFLKSEGRRYKELQLGAEGMMRIARQLQAGEAKAQSAFREMAQGVRSAGAKAPVARIGDERELGEIINKVIAENPMDVVEFRSGRGDKFDVLFLKVMRASQGRAEPAAVRRLLEKRLGNASFPNQNL